MAFLAPSLMDVEPPQMPGHSPQVALRMLDCSLELLTDPDLFKSADCGLSDHVNHTALAWPGQNGAPSSRIFPYGIVPLSVPYQSQAAHLNSEVIIDPELLGSVKLEGGYSCLSGGPEYDTSSEFRSSTCVDSLVQTIQTKSECRRPSLSSHSFSDPALSQSSPRTKTSQPGQHGYEHNSRGARKTYRCSVASCAKTFHQKSHLEIHVRAHNGYKPFSHQNRFHASTLRELNAKFASMQEGDPVSANEKELWEYFAQLYRHSNKGIKGRGKDRRVSAAGSGSPRRERVRRERVRRERRRCRNVLSRQKGDEQTSEPVASSMDIVLDVFDTFLFDRLYATAFPRSFVAGASPKVIEDATATFSSMRELPTAVRSLNQFWNLEPSQYAVLSAWPRDNIWRQTLSLYLITWLFGFFVYFICASLSYLFIFDHATFTHPKYLKNQVSLEIKQALRALPIMAVFTVPFFVGEVQGYAKLYDAPADAPFWLYNILQFPLFICFTDFFIYWIHRGLHHPTVYRTLHKPHHKWIMPTPYASHAFHPLDGFAQSVPYHVFPFIFPLNKIAYVALFAFINIWTVFIHDGEYVANSSIINGAACHTMHHLYFNYNYGQFTTIWDRFGGSYRKPNEALFKRESKMSKQEWERQCKEMETVQREVEGDDDRNYSDEARRLQKKVM
ncbi:MAG: hypothetical protein Q9192_001982 [Flavoplaca navasiana]